VNIREEREPLVDVLEQEKTVSIIAELPGVEKSDIQLHTTETTLTLSVNTPQRKYYKQITLPTTVDPKKAQSRYKNGVLKVTMQKRQEVRRPEGKPIHIE
jgi:HSP20 family protein